MREMGKVPEALAAFREGVECLKPLFLRLPEAFKVLMTNLVREYIRASKEAGVEVDFDVLSDILPLLFSDEGKAGPE